MICYLKILACLPIDLLETFGGFTLHSILVPISRHLCTRSMQHNYGFKNGQNNRKIVSMDSHIHTDDRNLIEK